MGLIETWIEVLGFKQLSIVAITIFLPWIFVVWKGSNQKQNKYGIYSVQEGRKSVDYEAVLVGAPEEKARSWLDEVRAKFRYMGEGHHLMFAAFKKVRLPFFFSTHHFLTVRQAFRADPEGTTCRLQVLHPTATLHGGAEELADHSHELIIVCTRVPAG